jgi:hypothetical protein
MLGKLILLTAPDDLAGGKAKTPPGIGRRLIPKRVEGV